MATNDRSHQESIIGLFDQDMRWWSDVYREDLPRGFFSFEMRERLALVVEQLSGEIRKLDKPAVLECGCGSGDILAQLAPLPCALTGLDLNPRYLEMAAAKAPAATFLDGDVEQLPLPEGSFDIVYAVGVLPYVENDVQTVKEMARVTKKGGLVLISVPNYLMLHLFFDPYYIYRFSKKLFSAKNKDAEEGFNEGNIKRYSLVKLKKICRDCGLTEISTCSTSFGPLKFWRKELLPIRYSIRISENLRSLSEHKMFSAMNCVGNHLILTLRKDSSLK